MGEIELILLKFYREKSQESLISLSLQEITEWFWLEYKFGMEQIEENK